MELGHEWFYVNMRMLFPLNTGVDERRYEDLGLGLSSIMPVHIHGWSPCIMGLVWGPMM